MQYISSWFTSFSLSRCSWTRITPSHSLKYKVVFSISWNDADKVKKSSILALGMSFINTLTKNRTNIFKHRPLTDKGFSKFKQYNTKFIKKIIHCQITRCVAVCIYKIALIKCFKKLITYHFIHQFQRTVTTIIQ